MRTRRFAGKSDKDYWNSRRYGVNKILSKESRRGEKYCAEFLHRVDEKNKKQEKMILFREIFEGPFKERFREVFDDISTDLLEEWNRRENNREIAFANIQVEQKLINNGYMEALAVWRILFQELKTRLES